VHGIVLFLLLFFPDRRKYLLTRRFLIIDMKEIWVNCCTLCFRPVLLFRFVPISLSN